MLVLSAPAWRFVSGITLKFHNCVSCTVTHSCVLCTLRVQQQEVLVLGYVSGDGPVDLEGQAVLSASIITYLPIHTRSFPWGCQIYSQQLTLVVMDNPESTGKGQSL
jgi:hypothetical protein